MKMKNRMRLDKEICKLQRIRNKRQSDGALVGMMTCKVTINLNVLGLFMKNQVVRNLNSILVVTINRSGMRKKYLHIIK